MMGSLFLRTGISRHKDDDIDQLRVELLHNTMRREELVTRRSEFLFTEKGQRNSSGCSVVGGACVWYRDRHCERGGPVTERT